VPWIHHLVNQPGAGTESFRARMLDLQQAAGAAAQASERFIGLALFIDALVAGVEAAAQRKAGERMRLPAAAQSELWERASALPLEAAGGAFAKFAQSAALAVAAFSMQERDVLALIDRLPPGASMAPPYRRTRAMLRMWCAIARARADTAEQGRQELFALLSSRDAAPPAGEAAFDQARIVLSLAELDVAMGDDANAVAVLERVARPLTTQDVPLLLRLRASVDLAGALARSGRSADARNLLAAAVGEQELPQESSPVRDLLIVAKSYWLVLQARGATEGQRASYVTQLRKLDQYARSGGVPASIELWRQMCRDRGADRRGRGRRGRTHHPAGCALGGHGRVELRVLGRHRAVAGDHRDPTLSGRGISAGQVVRARRRSRAPLSAGPAACPSQERRHTRSRSVRKPVAGPRAASRQ
jgi:hypothetical protein